jgi:hypothetical protein
MLLKGSGELKDNFVHYIIIQTKLLIYKIKFFWYFTYKQDPQVVVFYSAKKF